MRPMQYLSTRPKLVRGLKLGAVIVAGLAATGLILTLGLLWYLPLTADFRDPSRLALTIQDRNGQAIAYRGVSPGGMLPLSSMPEHLPNAFIAFEDRRFRHHPGIDVFGIARAAAVNASAGSWRQGASTLTQQLVKNTYLTPEKTLTRKIQEAALALWLERRLTKDEIIERYLNTVYLGAGAYGVDAASRRYFGKSASEASLSEAAMLAGLAQAPSRTAPTVALKTAQERASLVLDSMVDVGSISPEQAAEAKAKPATLAAQPASAIATAYPADWAAATVRADLGDLSGSLTVRTTLDPGLQELATRTLQAVLGKEGPDAGASQGALVAMQPDGRILALVGGVDYAASEYNRAVQARRQPGSLFKLFVYLAALQAGVQPTDRLEDQPITIDGWSPGNYTNKFHGTVTVREAFARSYNAASVRLQERVGRDQVIELAKSMGISGSLPPHPSLVLGTTEVSLVEITAAFAAVQAGKTRVQPRIVESLTTPAGLPLKAPADPIPDAQWPRAAMLDLLKAVVDGGTGGAAQLSVPAYGKTGTTQDNRDAWFVGFAGDLVVGVWVGNDDDQPMNKVTGGSLPARLWQTFMTDALKGAPAYSETLVAGAQPGSLPLIEGRASVVDTGTLQVDGQKVRLLGVIGVSGAPAQAMADYISDRDVQCQPSTNGQHRCEVNGWDLSEVVLFNGGGRASPDAPAVYVRAERKARSEQKGIWASGG